MVKKIAINGFGRIGRLFFRGVMNNKDIQVVAINDLTDAKTLAHLLKYDSAHGVLKNEIKVEGNAIVVDGHKITIYAEKDPASLPWKDLGIDVVIESTGRFVDKAGAGKHIEAGAKKVVISAPAKEKDVPTVVYNVNHDILKASDTVISAASCTTNALAPVAKALDDAFGIVTGFMTTIHAYTADQRIQDAPHSDLRRARAGAYSMIPTSTGAAKAIGLVLPKLNGKMNGSAIRVPTLTGSIIDLTCQLSKTPTVEEINSVIKKAANDTLAYQPDPIVSCDIIGDSHGSIFDPALTSVLEVDGQRLYKVFTWYDNEASYVGQLIRTAIHFSKL